MECGVVVRHYEVPYFHPRHRHPPCWNGPANNNVGPAYRLRTVSDVSAPAYTNGACPLLRLVSVAYKNGTLTTVVFHCPMHQPPHGARGLTVPDDETIEWLLMWSSSELKELAQTMKKNSLRELC